MAISDESGKIAFPKFVWSTDRHLLTKIVDFCKKEKIEAIVLGESLNYKSQPNAIQSDIANWKLKIEKFTGLPVIYELELLTSRQAERHSDKASADASAAAIILQSYLDKI